eukprot:1184350-Prorocentrum_minimum.AAC.3
MCFFPAAQGRPAASSQRRQEHAGADAREGAGDEKGEREAALRRHRRGGGGQVDFFLRALPHEETLTYYFSLTQDLLVTYS